MNSLLLFLVALCTVSSLVRSQSCPLRITFFSEENFSGLKVVRVGNITDIDVPFIIVRSVTVDNGNWSLFTDANHHGNQYIVFANGGPNQDGKYPTGNSWGAQGIVLIHSILANNETVAVPLHNNRALLDTWSEKPQNTESDIEDGGDDIEGSGDEIEDDDAEDSGDDVENSGDEIEDQVPATIQKKVKSSPKQKIIDATKSDATTSKSVKQPSTKPAASSVAASESVNDSGEGDKSDEMGDDDANSFMDGFASGKGNSQNDEGNSQNGEGNSQNGEGNSQQSGDFEGGNPTSSLEGSESANQEHSDNVHDTDSASGESFANQEHSDSVNIDEPSDFKNMEK